MTTTKPPKKKRIPKICESIEQPYTWSKNPKNFKAVWGIEIANHMEIIERALTVFSA